MCTIRLALTHCTVKCDSRSRWQCDAGCFREGLRHGQGTLTLPGSNGQTYSGQWVDDQKHGWGAMTYANVDSYAGYWRHDVKDGYGTANWVTIGERYRGQWRDGAQHGVGEHVWFKGLQPDHSTHGSVVRCNRYIGLMVDGRRHGEGVMLYASGAPAPHRCSGPARIRLSLILSKL